MKLIGDISRILLRNALMKSKLAANYLYMNKYLIYD